MKSGKARKQRKAYFNAPLHKKQKNISSHLEENLLLKYDRRSVPLITGDTVKVLRGAYKGHEDKVAHIHVKDYQVEVEGATITKADGKKIAKPLHPSNLLITKLNLTDKWRRKNLESKVSSETKKEIEAEAKQQLKEAELEQKQKEEEQRAAEVDTEMTKDDESNGEDFNKQSDESKPEEESKKQEKPKEKKSSTKTSDKTDGKPSSTSKKTADVSTPKAKKSSSKTSSSSSKNKEKKEKS